MPKMKYYDTGTSTWKELDAKNADTVGGLLPTAFATTAHIHAAADVTSGVFAIGRIPTGTSGTTVAIGNHTHLIGALTDVTLTTVSSGNFIRYNGTAWVNAMLTASDIPVLDTAKITTGIFDIARIPTGSTGTTVALGNHAHSLATITGVTLTTPASGHYLRYNGSAWVNVSITAADVPSLDTTKLTTGTLGVARGGTGAGTFTAGNLLYGNGTSALSTDANLTYASSKLSVPYLALTGTTKTAGALYVGTTAPTSSSVTLNFDGILRGTTVEAGTLTVSGGGSIAGIVTVPTQLQGTSSNQIASTAYVTTADVNLEGSIFTQLSLASGAGSVGTVNIGYGAGRTIQQELVSLKAGVDIGTKTQTTTNLNNITANGEYYATNATLNTPTVDFYHVKHQNHESDVNYMTQEAYYVFGNRTYTRRKSGGTWLPWTEVFVGSKSQLATQTPVSMGVIAFNMAPQTQTRVTIGNYTYFAGVTTGTIWKVLRFDWTTKTWTQLATLPGSGEFGNSVYNADHNCIYFSVLISTTYYVYKYDIPGNTCVQLYSTGAANNNNMAPGISYQNLKILLLYPGTSTSPYTNYNMHWRILNTSGGSLNSGVTSLPLGTSSVPSIVVANEIPGSLLMVNYNYSPTSTYKIAMNTSNDTASCLALGVPGYTARTPLTGGLTLGTNSLTSNATNSIRDINNSIHAKVPPGLSLGIDFVANPLNTAEWELWNFVEDPSVYKVVLSKTYS